MFATKFASVLMLSASLSLAACAGSDELATEPGQSLGATAGEGDERLAVVEETGEAAPEAQAEKVLDIVVTDDIPRNEDRLQLVSARVDGNLLRMNVRYGGGCRDHEIGMYWTGRVFESLPPQVDLAVRHDAKEDPCYAIKWEELAFDLTPIRESASGLVVINIAGSGVDTQVRLTDSDSPE